MTAWNGVAHASAGPPPLDEYRAPPSCPGAASFSAQVAARTPKFRAEPARFHVAVEIVELEDALVGRVRLSREGHESVRELGARRCDELVRALALIVAILVDPNADTRPLPVAAAAPPAPAPPPARPPPAELVRSPVLGAGTGAVADTGILSNLAFGPRAFVELVFPRDKALPSSLRLTVLREWSGRVDGGGGASVTADLTTARFDFCWSRLRLGSVALSPCTSVEAGALHVEGTHPVRNGEHTLSWVALGAEARGTYSYLGVAFVEAEVGATLPLSRYRFRFEGEPALYVTSVLGVHLGLGLGVRFP